MISFSNEATKLRASSEEGLLIFFHHIAVSDLSNLVEQHRLNCELLLPVICNEKRLRGAKLLLPGQIEWQSCPLAKQ